MKLPRSHFQGHNIWILKATGFNRGMGIHVFNKLDELQRLIKEYTEGTVAESNVVQPKDKGKESKQTLNATANN